MTRRLSKDNLRSLRTYGLLFLLFFVMHYLFLGDLWFETDELDIMIGGRAVLNGYQLYSDFFSQHMPVAYYISALFCILGAGTVTLQRIYFYIFYAAMWTIMYGRYKKYVNETALVIYPVLFTFVITTYDKGTTILSEHLAGIGFVFLFLEYLRFYKTGELKTGSCILIAYSVLLSFGTIFIGVFGVAGVALGVGITEIVRCVQEKEKFGPWLIRMLKRYGRLIGIVLIPWVILISYYYIIGNLEAAFYGAYTFNRTVYTEYNGGYGNSIMKTMLQGFVYIFELITSAFTFSSINYAVVVDIILIGLMFCYFIKLVRKGDVLPALTAFMLMGFASVRGIFSFHGTHAVAVLCLLASLFLGETVFVSFGEFKKAELKKHIAVGLLGILFISCYISNMKTVKLPNYVSTYYGEEWIVEAITEEDEWVWMNATCNAFLMNTNRVGILNAGVTPWGWEAFGEETLERIEADPPRVAILNKDLDVWDMLITDYAADLITYIDENYTQYEDSFVYIRNDYYDEAMTVIEGMQ